jgi:hypothetical protein
VLGVAVGELGERGEESFNARALDLTELTRENGLAAPCAYRRCEDNLDSSAPVASVYSTN